MLLSTVKDWIITGRLFFEERSKLYHYTSVEALYNIISKKTFWLVNTTSSNDLTELRISKNELISLLKTIKDMQRGDGIKNFIDSLIKTAEDDFEIPFPHHNHFMICLTEDTDHLSHWERYADNKQGVAIGLDANKINDISSNQPFSPLCFYKMIYEEKDFIDTAAFFIKHFYKLSISDCIFKMPSFVLYSLYSTIITHKKNSSFLGENEIRIDYRPQIYNELNRRHSEFANSDLEQIYFAPIRGEIRSLHHLCLKDIWGSDLIPEIMLGPNCPQSKDELRYFLNENGLTGTKITESEIPIR
ncbi:MAG: DUF2971 domain-containing protein [Alphaproteobacteria bacterium]